MWVGVRSTLGVLLAEKGAAGNRRITFREIAREYGITEEAISNLAANKTTRFDAHVLSALCDYLAVRPGDPIPFLVYEPDTQEHTG